MAKLIVAALVVSLPSSTGARFKRKATSDDKTDCYSMYDKQHLLSLTPCATNDIQQMQEAISASNCVEVTNAGFEKKGGGCVEASVICSASTSANLTESFGSLVSVDSFDAGAHMRASAGVPAKMTDGARSTFYSDFRLTDDQIQQVEMAVTNSGGACTLEEIGRTFENRPMKAVRARGANYSPGGPRVVLTFGIHPREWVAPMTGVYAVEQICARAKADPSWIAPAEIVMVPMGNPDGHVYSTTVDAYWRKNRNTNGGSSCKGVDLNRNWPVDFGGPHSTSTDKCSQVYHGPSAMSEPESKAIGSVIDESPVTVLLDVHCYGRYILKPYGYSYATHPRIQEVDELGNWMFEAIKRHRNNRFQYGGSELLYPASGVLPDYSNGGLGYTFELTTSFHPSRSEILPSAIETFDAIDAAISWAKGEPAPAPAPTPEPLVCPEWSRYREPDSDGDCGCPSGTYCSADGGSSQNCPSSGGIGGWGGRYFYPSCSDCMCY